VRLHLGRGRVGFAREDGSTMRVASNARRRRWGRPCSFDLDVDELGEVRISTSEEGFACDRDGDVEVEAVRGLLECALAAA